jgi:hypothetical protein
MRRIDDLARYRESGIRRAAAPFADVTHPVVPRVRAPEVIDLKAALLEIAAASASSTVKSAVPMSVALKDQALEKRGIGNEES